MKNKIEKKYVNREKKERERENKDHRSNGRKRKSEKETESNSVYHLPPIIIQAIFHIRPTCLSLIKNTILIFQKDKDRAPFFSGFLIQKAIRRCDFINKIEREFV